MPDPFATDTSAGLFPPPPGESLSNNSLPPTVVKNDQPPSAISHDLTTQPSHGRYAIVSEHARGGLGKVSLATDTKLGRTVALKEIRPDRQPSPEDVERFVNEAAITGFLEHPGIVPIYSLDEDENGKPYYAMRFIAGQSLKKAIEEYHGNLTPPRSPLSEFRKLLNHFIAVCNAIGYAHSKGVIHRDLKPENIMLGDYGETLVVDWGLAKQVAGLQGSEVVEQKQATGSSVSSSPPHHPTTSLPHHPTTSMTHHPTQVGRIMGTPAFMSPEQARGENDTLGPAADIYALGGILYSILTGQPPFTGNAFDIVSKVQSDTAPPPPTAVKEGAPKALAAVCVKAMKPCATDRYSSAIALAAEVERWLADEPTTAYVEPWSVRARRWMRRHRMLVTSGMLVLLALTAVAIVSAVLSEQGRQQVQKEKDNTEQQRQQAVAAGQRERIAKLQARQAVRTLTADPQLTALEKQPYLTAEQIKQLQELADFYRTCAKDATETEEELKQQGTDYVQLGKVLKMLGQLEEALTAYGYSLEIEKKLVAAHPDAPERQADLAWAWHNLGIVQGVMGRFQDAEGSYQQSQHLREKLAAAHPTVPQYQAHLANSWCSLALLYATMQRFEAAQANYQRARLLQEKLTAAHPAHAQYQEDLADTLHGLAMLLGSQGQTTAAEADYLHAQQLFEKLVAAYPRHVEYQIKLAYLWSNLAGLQKSGKRLRDAADTYQKARLLQEKLVATYPSNLRCQASLAYTCRSLGQLQAESGQPHEAEASYHHARELFEAMVFAYPAVPAFEDWLADVWQSLASVQGTLKRPADAEASLQRARQRWEKLTAAYPSVTSYRVNLGIAYCNLGQLENDRQFFGAALLSFDHAQQTLMSVLQKEPHERVARLYLTNTCINRAFSLYQLARHVEAVQGWSQALTLDDGRFRSQINKFRLLALPLALDQATARARLGLHLPAVQSANILSPLTDLPADTWPQLARVLTLCSVSQGTWFLSPPTAQEREKYAAQAVELLRRGRASGFFAAMVQAGQWQNDPDFAPLRQREDYRQVLRAHHP